MHQYLNSEIQLHRKGEERKKEFGTRRRVSMKFGKWANFVMPFFTASQPPCSNGRSPEKRKVLSRSAVAFVKVVLFCFRYKRPLCQIQNWRSATVQVQDHLQGTESSMGREFYVTD